MIQDLHSHKWNYGVIAQFIEWDQFTQELHISGEAFDGRLSYLGGLYYGTEEGHQVFPVEFRNFGFDSGGEIDNDTYAVFGQATYDITIRVDFSYAPITVGEMIRPVLFLQLLLSNILRGENQSSFNLTLPDNSHSRDNGNPVSKSSL